MFTFSRQIRALELTESKHEIRWRTLSKPRRSVPLSETVATVLYACRILSHLKATTPLTVRAAADVAECSASAAHRILTTLHAHGFALQDSRGQYRAALHDIIDKSPSPAPPEAIPSSSIVLSVHRALLLLRRLAHGVVLSVKESGNFLGVAPSTAFRLLNSLSLEKFAVQLADRRYRLGPAMYPARRMPSLADLRQTVASIAFNVQAETGETVHVWGPTGPYVKLVYGVAGSRPDAVPHDRWPRVPAYTTAGGRSMLSTLPNSEVEMIHTEGLLPWRVSPITSLSRLKQRLAVVRRRGYDTNIEEGAQGVSGLALASTDPLQQPLLALGLALPSARFSPSQVAQYQKILYEAKDAIEIAFQNEFLKG